MNNSLSLRAAVGRSLKIARVLKGLKGKEVYEPLGITAPRLTDMESGRRPLGEDLLPQWKEIVKWKPVILDFVYAVIEHPDAEIEIVVHGPGESERSTGN